MSFLKAEWRKLAIANYQVEPEMLAKYLPFGTELDFWEGKCFVSLVGFVFVNTKLLGVKIPFHVHFEEVNLRFYVKRWDGVSWKRGVVFVKEIVPKPALTFVANAIYKENYETSKMKHMWSRDKENLSVCYEWQKDSKWNKFCVSGSTDLVNIASGSETEFITEHYWGYAKASEGQTVEYEVTHPRWNVYEVNDYNIAVDFGLVYGAEWSFLSNSEPVSVMLAEGSEITVEKNKKIKKSV
ncbi:YqjF family protein [Jiulongibacter sediminis]|uniref:DUF2071 domain-containing protein n=1 Tax=Jiulongibacter sediminis TaxID=1605367 RepID=A0A0N8H9W2_9BACT|nr:DUF2071 domain-containing protein [Jiulongibacter sediminis]KPM48484.1 hypothetical protein AFM12_07590 [Jiulongibacter sediminis]TBX25023.1 hypothetical protein TK44_07595 [Jiulongibacter sediminis]